MLNEKINTMKKIEVLLNKNLEFNFIPQNIKSYFSPSIFYSWENILFLMTNVCIMFNLFLFLGYPLANLFDHLYFPKEGFQSDGEYRGFGLYIYILTLLTILFVKYSILPLIITIINILTKNISIKDYTNNIKFKDMGIILIIVFSIDFCFFYIKQFFVDYYRINYDMRADIWFGGLFGSYLVLFIIYFINKYRKKFLKEKFMQ